MTKNFLSVSIIFFGICLLLSAWFISNAIQNIDFPVESGEVTVSQTEAYSYELIVANKETLILFNKENGEYWKKPIDSKGSPEDWGYQPAPWGHE